MGPVIVQKLPSRSRPWDLEEGRFATPEAMLLALYADALKPRIREEKDGPAVAFVKLEPRADGSFAGFQGKPTRNPYLVNDNVSHVTALSVDYDGVPEEAFGAWVASLETRGLAFLIYATHSYGKPHKPGVSYRVVFPFSGPVPIGSAARWKNVLWPALMRYVGADLTAALKADPSCSDARRLFYLPSWDPTNPVPRPAPIYQPGKPIPVATVLEAELLQPYVISRTTAPSEIDGTRDADPKEVRKRLKRKFKKPPHALVVDLALSGQPLILNKQRHQAILRLTEALAYVAEPDETNESLLNAVGDAIEATARVVEAEDPSRNVHDETEKALAGARGRVAEWREKRDKEKAAQFDAWANLINWNPKGGGK